MTRKSVLLFLFVATIATAYMKGRADNEARHTAAALAQAQADAKATAALAAAEEANRMLSRALEDAAYADPPSALCGLPRTRVLRLRDR